MSEHATETPGDGQDVPKKAPKPGQETAGTGTISGTFRYPARPKATPPALPVLMAEDDPISARVLSATLRQWGHEPVFAPDGLAAWEILQREDSPKLAIIDWNMPGLEGPEICRRARALARPVPTYIILLTGRGRPEDVVTGLESGADDYVTKPFDRQELRSRLRVGERVVALQQGMADRVRELETLLSQVKQLKGLLPICSYCMKVRDDRNYWQKVETYIAAHSSARCTHGICPDCWRDVVEPELSAQGISG